VTESSTPAAARVPGVAFILAVVFLDIAGIGIAIPVVPKLVAGFVGGDMSEASKHVGTLSAIYTTMMFLCAPLLGALSDRFGRKPVLLVALAATVASNFWTALATSLVALFASRALGGVGGGSVAVAQTYLADVSNPEDRAKHFGLIGAAFGMGFIIGPAIGGWLGTYGPQMPFLASGVVALLNLLYGLFFMAESHKAENRRAFRWVEANPMGWVVVLRRHRAVLGFAAALVWVWFGQQCMYNTWVLYTTHRFGWGPAENGLSLTVVGITTAIVQGALIGRLLPMLGETRAIVGGLTWSALILVAYGLAPQGWMMYAIIAIGSVAGIAGPSLQGLMSRQVGPSEQGAVQGAMTSLNSVTGIFGPLVANNLFAYVTAAHTPLHLPGAPFFLGALCTLVGAALTWRLLARPTEAPVPVEAQAA
jgi:DHA1 family tetracycline resistance protein-like MFS transporter